MLLMTSFGNRADLAHHYCFLVKRSLPVPCMPRSARKNKSSPLHILVLHLMHLWGDGWRESRVRTMPWRGRQHPAVSVGYSIQPRHNAARQPGQTLIEDFSAIGVGISAWFGLQCSLRKSMCFFCTKPHSGHCMLPLRGEYPGKISCTC